jgi:hypothetical protein
VVAHVNPRMSFSSRYAGLLRGNLDARGHGSACHLVVDVRMGGKSCMCVAGALHFGGGDGIPGQISCEGDNMPLATACGSGDLRKSVWGEARKMFRAEHFASGDDGVECRFGFFFDFWGVRQN